MTERGDLTSINQDSDVDFVYKCSPCGDDDIREKAVKCCPECEEYLCATCTRHHGRRKATRTHSLRDCDISMKESAITMAIKCRYHPDRDIEMFCGDHDMVYCTKCIATEHRLCKWVCSLEEPNVPSNQQKEIERLKTETTYMQTRLEDTERKTQTNIDRAEDKKCDTISRIEGLERDFVEHIRELKQEALESLETEFNVVNEKLVTNISEVKRVRLEIERGCHQLQAVDNADKMLQFVQTKLMQHSVNDAMKVIEENEGNECHDLCFTENKELKSSIITSTSLGRIQNLNEVSNNQLSSKVYKVISKKRIFVRMANEKKVCYISDICQLPEGTIILADIDNQRIKRLDVNYNSKDYFDVGDRPQGICCTGNTEIAVKLSNNKVQFISVGSSLSILREIAVEDRGGGNWGIAYCGGELWISTRSDVDVYSSNGTLLKTISKDVNGHEIFKTSTQLMAVRGDTVFVTDYNDGTVFLKRDGTVKKVLRDRRLRHTCGVCASNDGTVFVAWLDSHNIVMFDRDGKCLGELLNNEDGLKYPISMCYDKKNKCVLVACMDSSALFVLNFSN